MNVVSKILLKGITKSQKSWVILKEFDATHNNGNRSLYSAKEPQRIIESRIIYNKFFENNYKESDTIHMNPEASHGIFKSKVTIYKFFPAISSFFFMSLELVC